MTLRRVVTVFTAVAVLAGLAGLPVAAAEPGGPGAYAATGLRAPTARAGVIEYRTGRLTSRPDGFPTTTMSARRLSSVSVKQELKAEKVSATIVLKAAPSAGANADVHLTFGRLDGNNCNGEAEVRFDTAGGDRPGIDVSGSTITVRRNLEGAGYEPWNCAFVALTRVGSTATTYDVLIGALTNVYAKPKLRLSGPAKIWLVRGVWTKVRLRVSNAGYVTAKGVKVTGSGNGVRAQRTGVPYGVGDESWSYVKVPILLTVKRATRIKLVVTASNGGRATKWIAVQPVPAPRPPVPGRYRGTGADNDVTFRVTKGTPYLTGWRGFLTGTCGGFPDIPSPASGWYSFPRTRIPRNGIIDREFRGGSGTARYTVTMELKIVGSWVGRGKMRYYGPAQCRLGTEFQARRIGR